MAESVGKWDASSVGRYYDAFHKHGTNWPAVSEAASRGVDTCEALYRQHQTFLGLPHSPALGAAFVAMVKDHYNNIKDEGGDEADGAVQDGAGAGVAAAAGSGDMDTRGGGGTAGVDATTEDAMDAEADDEGTSNLAANGGRSKRTPKPSAKVLAASPPSSKRAAAGMSPTSARAKGAKTPAGGPASAHAGGAGGAEDEPASARKRRQRKLFADEGGQAGGLPLSWKTRHANDDVGEGVDALLSLASIAHNHHATSEAKPEASASAPDAADTTEGAKRGGDGGGGSGRAAAGIAGLQSPSKSGGKRGLTSPSRAAAGGGHGGSGGPGGRAGGGAAAAAAAAGQGVHRSGGGTGAGGRPKRAASARRRSYAFSDSSDGGDGADYSDGVPLQVAPLRTGSGTSDPVLGKRGRDHKRGGGGGDGMHGGMGGVDYGGYDPALMASLVGLPGGSGYGGGGRSVRGGAPPQQLKGSRRRKPQPERIPPMSPLMKSLMPGGGRGGGTNGGHALPGYTPTQGSAMAAAASAALNSPGLLVSPGFLQGMSAASPDLFGREESSLRHCLSSQRMRRWCAFEFHCSALDRPWFLRNELAELLQLVVGPAGMGGGLGRGSDGGGGGGGGGVKLTRTEWALLRSSFGRPRRFSQQFLKEERVKLEAYREHVRRIYEEASTGLEVPAELPRPLRVGQAVVARHPLTRQLHDGTILTATGYKYRVQFDRSELMTEMVRDVDIMPVDPYENLPINIPLVPALLNGRPRLPPGVGQRRRPAARHIPRGAPADTGRLAPFHPHSIPEQEPVVREADENLLAEVNRLLEEKETLLTRLRELHSAAEDAQLGEHDQHPEQFQTLYSQVVLQLKDTNAHLDGLLAKLGGRSAVLTNVASMGMGMGAPGHHHGGGHGGATGTGGGGHGSGSSPIAAVPPGSAMVMAMTAAAASGSFHTNAATASLLAQLTGGGMGDGMGGLGGMHGGNGGMGAGSMSALLMGGLDATGKGAVATTMLAVASADARGVVARYKGSKLDDAARASDSNGGAVPSAARPDDCDAGTDATETLGEPGLGSGGGGRSVTRLVTSCVALLLTVQQCTGEAVSEAAMDDALCAALRALTPSCPANAGAFDAVEASVKTLCAHLAGKAV